MLGEYLGWQIFELKVKCSYYLETKVFRFWTLDRLTVKSASSYHLFLIQVVSIKFITHERE